MEEEYKWNRAYQSAVLETDNEELERKIEVARTAIDHRLGELPMGNNGEERQAIAQALLALRVLWIERIGDGQASQRL